MTIIVKYFDEDDYDESRERYEQRFRDFLPEDADFVGTYFRRAIGPLGEDLHGIIVQLDRPFRRKDEDLIGSIRVALQEFEMEVFEEYGYVDISWECRCAECGKWTRSTFFLDNEAMTCRKCRGKNG